MSLFYLVLVLLLTSGPRSTLPQEDRLLVPAFSGVFKHEASWGRDWIVCRVKVDRMADAEHVSYMGSLARALQLVGVVEISQASLSLSVWLSVFCLSSLPAGLEYNMLFAVLPFLVYSWLGVLLGVRVAGEEFARLVEKKIWRRSKQARRANKQQFCRKGRLFLLRPLGGHSCKEKGD